MLHASNRTPSSRTLQHLVLVLSAAAGAAMFGCTSAPDQATGSAPANANSAPAAEPSYPYSRKEEFTTFMKTNLDKLNQEIEQLAAKISTLSAAAQADAKEKLQALREQAQRLGQHFDKVQNASAGSWDAAKADMSKAYDDLKAGITKARQWLSEKIAPTP